MTPRRFHSLGTAVDAVQVPDDLGAIMTIADWIHDNGGRLTDPLHTFDCAFRLHGSDGTVPVHVGDWVVRYVNGGEFCTWGARPFAEAFKLVDVTRG